MKPLIGLIRIRNEELILQDTLDHMAEFCDKIYLFDDASTDGSSTIYKKHPKVDWSKNHGEWDSNQTEVQGEQRSMLFEYAKFLHPGANFIYMDADERIDFDFKNYDGESAVVVKLFDARMTTDDCKGFKEECDTYPKIAIKLEDFREYFDPQFREIPFIFNDKAKYVGVACERYPQFDPAQPVIHAGFVQHYGKALSKEHWQKTCEYYAKYLPVYAEKWEARKKETGVVSSEGLLTWEECKKV